jgi:hypothetical protein
MASPEKKESCVLYSSKTSNKIGETSRSDLDFSLLGGVEYARFSEVFSQSLG